MLRRIVPLALLAKASFALYAPIYTPVYLPSGPTVSIRDPLPKPFTSRPSGSQARLKSTDTVELRMTDACRPDTSGIRTRNRSALPTAEAEQPWGDSVRSILMESLHRRLVGAYARVDTSSVATTPDSSLQAPDGAGASSAILVVGDLALHHHFAGASDTQGVWIRGAQVRWGLWERARQRWMVQGRTVLRKGTSDTGPIAAQEAGERLAKAIHEAIPGPRKSDAVDARRTREKIGGFMVLLRGNLAAHTGGDSKKVAKANDLSASTISGGAMVAIYPSFYGFGMGTEFGVVEASQSQQDGGRSSFLFGRRMVFGEGALLMPVGEGGGAVGLKMAIGRVTYAWDQLGVTPSLENPHPDMGDMTGSMFRPSLTLQGTSGHMVARLSIGLEFVSVSNRDFRWKDDLLHIGLEFGARGFYKR